MIKKGRVLFSALHTLQRDQSQKCSLNSKNHISSPVHKLIIKNYAAGQERGEETKEETDAAGWKIAQNAAPTTGTCVPLSHVTPVTSAVTSRRSFQGREKQLTNLKTPTYNYEFKNSCVLSIKMIRPVALLCFFLVAI